MQSLFFSEKFAETGNFCVRGPSKYAERPLPGRRKGDYLMKLNRILCGALAATVLSVPALAAHIMPINAEVEVPTVPEFTLAQYKRLSPHRTWGTVGEIGEDCLLLNEGGAEAGELILHISEQTLILDAVTGEPHALADINKGDSLTVWTSPAVTMSLPPQSAAQVILCNIPADYSVPHYAEIQQVLESEGGKVSVLTSDNVILKLDEATELVAYKTRNMVGLDELKPGVRVLSWYSATTRSLPSQASPDKVMVFPYEYAGWLTAIAADQVSVNGEALSVPGYVKGGTLMLPVRALAEALDCEVLWTTETPDQVVVNRAGKTLYTLTLGEDAVAEAGVTYLAADELIDLHNLKAEHRWPLEM